MTNRYQNKYRIESARLKNWDYRWAGVYFITICTHNRKPYLGHISNGKMELSHVGIVAYIVWYEIVNHTLNVELGAFVAMPNHIHGILILNGNDFDTDPNATNYVRRHNRRHNHRPTNL